VVTVGTVAAILAVASLSGQAPGPNDAAASAIRELTTEVRGLRVAVERTSASQVQGQILGMYLNVQQSRVAQAMNRLDVVRRELEQITMQAQETAQNMSALEMRLPQETDPAHRTEVEMQLRAMKQESESLAAREQQVRAREAEASQSQQTEEQRWTELIGRLEQLLKK
jgi:hypothetical protein